MSHIQANGLAPAQRQPSPILSSNNPFRNRTVSPQNGPPSPNSASERPRSRNPFLDQPGQRDAAKSPERMLSPAHSPAKASTREMFGKLIINDAVKGRPVPGPMPGRGENSRPRGNRHQASLSEEDDAGVKPRRVAETLDIFADPPSKAKPRPRPRRNSESSIASKTLGKDDQRRRDRRDKEPRQGKSKSKPKTPTARLDVIDSLDVTSIYGRGLFHHDGPFDACNPDRNRKGSRRAPMEAFAAGSANNTIGGSGPINKNLNVTQYHGHGAEGFTDFSSSGSHNPLVAPVSFDTDSGTTATARTGQGIKTFSPESTTEVIPNNRVTLLHGEETLGLGTSTFLEGTPAARAAIQRREDETDAVDASQNGPGSLGRKRSLAQKIRGISNTNRVPPRPSNTVRSPDDRTMPPPLIRGESQSAAGMARIREKTAQAESARDRRDSIGGGEDEINADAAARSRLRAVSSPQRPMHANPLQRSTTSESMSVQGGLQPPVERRNRQGSLSNTSTISSAERKGSITGSGTRGQGTGSGSEAYSAEKPLGTASSGGFISRVKSLKGGKRRPA